MLEPLSGYLFLAYHQSIDGANYADSFNFGPNPLESGTVELLIQLAIKRWGKGNYRVVKDIESVHEAGLLKLDIQKAEAQLNWRPVYTSQKAIEETIDWYKVFQEHRDDIISFSYCQIAAYEQQMFQ